MTQHPPALVVFPAVEEDGVALHVGLEWDGMPHCWMDLWLTVFVYRGETLVGPRLSLAARVDAWPEGNQVELAEVRPRWKPGPPPLTDDLIPAW